MKTFFHQKLEKMNRRFYEVFGDLEAQVEFLKTAFFILSVLLLMTLLGAYFLAHKPPVVIRVSELGEAKAVQDVKSETETRYPELIFFSRLFVKRFSEFNAYTLSRDLEEAFGLMTRKFQETADQDYLGSGLISKIKEAGLNMQIEFREAIVEKNTPEAALVSITGVRTITSYKNPAYKEASFFKWDLVLKKYKRSVSIPFGVLVDHYKETLLNRLEDQK